MGSPPFLPSLHFLFPPSVPPSFHPSSLFTLSGIVFNNVNRTKNDGRLEYTLRLRHEVGEDDSWETREAAPNFQLTGPRVRNKSAKIFLQLPHFFSPSKNFSSLFPKIFSLS